LHSFAGNAPVEVEVEVAVEGWDRVIAVAAEGMAAAKTTEREPPATERAMTGDRLRRVLRATR
jgi:hypothetical protein